MNKPSAKIICHSKSPSGEELITVEIELHRFVLAENNTHRVFSRNYSSSRAIPVLKQLHQIVFDTAYPVHWGKNQSGMQANEELSGVRLFLAKGLWKSASLSAALHSYLMYKLGVHKQISNRPIEPYMWTKGVITTTRENWNSFFKLRRHWAAQPEIKLLADRIYEAIENSVPTNLSYGEWHLPYVQMQYPDTGQTSFDNETLEECIKIAISCCSQVSYRKLDDSLEKALTIYDRLNLPEIGKFPDDPPHFSPAEHIALCDFRQGISLSGNFNSEEFIQYRKLLELGIENYFIGRYC